jgi:MerR family transcriptional regulator, copper efflux regulator
MKIGSVASKTELSIDTLRFYEREGLISSPRRLFSGYRDYPEEVLGRLDFIKEAKGLGFSLREIKELLSMGVKSTRECGPVTHKAQQKLAEMEAEVERLQRLRRTLRKMVRDCDGSCMQARNGIARKNGRPH